MMTCNKYRKITTVKVIQWTGKNLKEVIDLGDWLYYTIRYGPFNSMGVNNGERFEDIDGNRAEGQLILRTRKKELPIRIGEYLAKERVGDYYIIEPDIFTKTYEEVESSEAQQPKT